MELDQNFDEDIIKTESLMMHLTTEIFIPVYLNNSPNICKKTISS